MFILPETVNLCEGFVSRIPILFLVASTKNVLVSKVALLVKLKVPFTFNVFDGFVSPMPMRFLVESIKNTLVSNVWLNASKVFDAFVFASVPLMAFTQFMYPFPEMNDASESFFALTYVPKVLFFATIYDAIVEFVASGPLNAFVHVIAFRLLMKRFPVTFASPKTFRRFCGFVVPIPILFLVASMKNTFVSNVWLNAPKVFEIFILARFV